MIVLQVLGSWLLISTVFSTALVMLRWRRKQREVHDLEMAWAPHDHIETTFRRLDGR